MPNDTIHKGNATATVVLNTGNYKRKINILRPRHICWKILQKKTLEEQELIPDLNTWRRYKEQPQTKKMYLCDLWQGSPTYELAKHLTPVLQQFTGLVDSNVEENTQTLIFDIISIFTEVLLVYTMLYLKTYFHRAYRQFIFQHFLTTTYFAFADKINE